MSRNVFVIGAGFSVGLGYPLLRNLLEFVWSDISEKNRETIAKVIKFHNPNFNPNHPFTFPDVETLLTQFDANIELFDHTRFNEGRFSKSELIKARNTLLIEMAKKFHATNKNIPIEKKEWLTSFKKFVSSKQSTIISFNYDLVLEKLLFDDNLLPENYGFLGDSNKLQILKPHGSLNWFAQDEKRGKLKKEKLQRLLKTDNVHIFKLYRHPVSKHGIDYVPHLIPPTFTKKFAGKVYETTLRNSVSALSKAQNVFFLGCSLPKSDFHSQFMIKCGLYNQIEGEILNKRTRKTPVGAANIIVVNPDENAAKNTLQLISDKHKISWKSMPVEKWANEVITS